MTNLHNQGDHAPLCGPDTLLGSLGSLGLGKRTKKTKGTICSTPGKVVPLLHTPERVLGLASSNPGDLLIEKREGPAIWNRLRPLGSPERQVPISSWSRAVTPSARARGDRSSVAQDSREITVPVWVGSTPPPPSVQLR